MLYSLLWHLPIRCSIPAWWGVTALSAWFSQILILLGFCCCCVCWAFLASVWVTMTPKLSLRLAGFPPITSLLYNRTTNFIHCLLWSSSLCARTPLYFYRTGQGGGSFTECKRVWDVFVLLGWGGQGDGWGVDWYMRPVKTSWELFLWVIKSSDT